MKTIYLFYLYWYLIFESDAIKVKIVQEKQKTKRDDGETNVISVESESVETDRIRSDRLKSKKN